jgi:hypothetical protein
MSQLLPENTGLSSVKKLWPGRLVSDAMNEHLKRIRRPGNKVRPIKKKRTSLPMLAKRIIVAAFAVAVVIGAPFAFPGQSDLFVDTPAALLAEVASN